MDSNQTWQQQYKRLYLADLKRRSPVFYNDSPDPERYLVWPKVNTANGLTTAICNFLRWAGHYSNRINTQGQARIQKIPKYSLATGKIIHLEKSYHTKSTTRKGTADIDAIIAGRSVKIEIKIGKDRISPDQVKEKIRVEKAGGIYLIIHTMDEFYQWFISLSFDDPDLYSTIDAYDY